MSKKRKVLLIAGLSLLALILIGTAYLYFNFNKVVESIVRKELIAKNNENPNSIYHLEIERVKFNFVAGSISIKGIRVTPRDSILAFRTVLKILPTTVFEIEIPELKLDGISYNELLNKQAELKAIRFIKPKIKVFVFDDTLKQNLSKDTASFQSALLEVLQNADAGLVSVENASAEIIRVSQSDSNELFSINPYSVVLTNVHMDESTLNSAQYVEYENLAISGENVVVRQKQKTQLNMGKLQYSNEDTSLYIDYFKFSPLQSKKKFSGKRRWRKAWVSFSADRIELKSINPTLLTEYQLVDIQELNIENGQIDAYVDTRIPKNPDKEILMLGEMVGKIPTPVHIHSLKWNSGKIHFETTNKENGNTGGLSFEEFSAEGTNISNIPERLKEDSYAILNARTLFMGGAALNVHFEFDQLSESGDFTFRANASNLSMKLLNPLLKPVAGVEINSGTITQLSLRSNANRYHADGNVVLKYEDLKMSILEMDDKTNALKKRGLISFIANEIIPSQNKADSKSYSEGIIDLDREPLDSFFKYIWLMLADGAEDIILGNKKKYEKRNRNKNTDKEQEKRKKKKKKKNKKKRKNK
jgi:hypothetical protein